MKERTIVRDALILFAITIIAGFALGVVHEITLEPIAAADYEAQQEAYRDVFPDAASFVEYPDFDEEKADEVVIDAGYADDSIDACMHLRRQHYPFPRCDGGRYRERILHHGHQ